MMNDVAWQAIDDLFDGALPGVYCYAHWKIAERNGTHVPFYAPSETWLDRLVFWVATLV